MRATNRSRRDTIPHPAASRSFLPRGAKALAAAILVQAHGAGAAEFSDGSTRINIDTTLSHGFSRRVSDTDDSYDWRLVGKREMYVPYNSYRLHSDQLAFEDVLTPLHVIPAHLRYELHRVWIVEATLKEGARHLYKRRTFYIDEDSWQILAVDMYDNWDELWRVGEGHAINYYEKPMIWPTLEVTTDLQAGRYPRVRPRQ